MDMADKATCMVRSADGRMRISLSGHGKTRIVGKPSFHVSPLKLVLWSWSKWRSFCKKFGSWRLRMHGGSARFLFKPDNKGGIP